MHLGIEVSHRFFLEGAYEPGIKASHRFYLEGAYELHLSDSTASGVTVAG